VKSEKLSNKIPFYYKVAPRVLFWTFLGMVILGSLYTIIFYDTYAELLAVKNKQHLSNLIHRIKQEKEVLGIGIVQRISLDIEKFQYIEAFSFVDKMVAQDKKLLQAQIIDTNGYVHHQSKKEQSFAPPKNDTQKTNPFPGLTYSEVYTKHNQTLMACHIPIVIQYDTWGKLQLIYYLDLLDREKERMKSLQSFLLYSHLIWIFGVWISCLISMGIALYIILSRHSKRIIQMTEAIEKFSPNKENVFKALAHSTDEISYLAKNIQLTFTYMVNKMKSSQSQYAQLQESYEDSNKLTEQTRSMLQEIQTGLKEWEYQCKRIFDGCQESLLFIDCQGLIMEANKTFLKLSGYTIQDIQGISIQDIIHKDFHSTFSQTFMRQIKTHTQTENIELTIRKKDQTDLNVSITGQLFFKKNTEPHKILIAAIDLTSEKQMKFIYNDLELLFKNEFKDTLGRIIGLSELMVVKSNVGKKDLLDWSRIIQQNARKMLDNVQQTLDSFKIEKNEYELRYRQCNLSQMFQKFISDYSSIILSKSIDIQFFMNDAPMIWDQMDDIWGDCNLLYTMFCRLLENIINQSPEHQKLTISFNQKTDLLITIACELQLSETTLNDFFSRHDDVSQKHRGAYIAMLIAKAHGGTIGIRSSDTHQAQFILILPNMQEEADAESNNRRILVVDDSPNNHLLMDFYLSDNTQFLRVSANNGQEAIERFQEKPYDIIFMDIEMPVMNGKTAIKAIREIEKNLPERTQQPSIIIAMSADSTDETIAEIMDAGADTFIVRPITPENINNILSEFK